MLVCACSFYVGHVRLFFSWGRRLALIRKNWCFLYVYFYKTTLASLYTYRSVYCKTRLPNLPRWVLYLIYKKYASMIRKEMPQITDQPMTDDNVQKRQRKRRKETQNTDGNKTDQTPSLPHPPHKMIGATLFIINNGSTTTEPPHLNNQHH